MSLQAARPKPWLVAVGGVIGVFLLAPTIVVVVLSFSSGKLMTFPPPGFSLEWYQAFFASDLWTASAWTSLEVALLATLLATSLGTAAALGLERHRPRGGGLLRALMLSPLVVPVIILAIGMFFALPNLRLEGRAALAVAHAVMGLPFVVGQGLIALILHLAPGGDHA